MKPHDIYSQRAGTDTLICLRLLLNNRPRAQLHVSPFVDAIMQMHALDESKYLICEGIKTSEKGLCNC